MENDTVCVASLNGRHLKQLFITRARILFLIYGIFYLLLLSWTDNMLHLRTCNRLVFYFVPFSTMVSSLTVGNSIRCTHFFRIFGGRLVMMLQSFEVLRSSFLYLPCCQGGLYLNLLSFSNDLISITQRLRIYFLSLSDFMS